MKIDLRQGDCLELMKDILLIISLCLIFGGGFGAIILMIIDMNRDEK